MRGDPQAVSSRLLAVLPGRRLSVRPARASRRPRLTPEERLEVIERLEAEVVRTREALDKKRARRDAADALFSFKS